MTVLDFWRLTQANLKLIFVLASAGLVLGFLSVAQTPRTYTAISVGQVTVDQGSTIGDAMQAQSFALSQAASYIPVVNSIGVAEKVTKRLHLHVPPAAIAGNFSAVADTLAPQITISATGTSPTEASRLANAVIGALSDQVQENAQAGMPQGATAPRLVTITPLQQASIPSTPTAPNIPKKMLTYTGVGVVLGYVVALLRRQIDRRVRSVEDVEGPLMTSVLTIIPESSELDRFRAGGIVVSHRGAAAEALRRLRTNLRFIDVDHPPRSLLFTSPNPTEGKSAVTANLARVLAAAGQKTVILDGDLRRPTQSELFDLDSAVGLTQVLAGDVELEDAMQNSGHDNLVVVTAGRIPPNPSELLGSRRMHNLIDSLVEQDYLVLIDAPPLLPVTDAGLLSGMVNGTIMVLAVDRTYQEQAKLAAKIIRQVDGRLLGAVLNRAAKSSIGSVLYGYGYGYSSRDYYSAYEGEGKRQEHPNEVERRHSKRKRRAIDSAVQGRRRRRKASDASRISSDMTGENSVVPASPTQRPGGPS